MPSTTPPPTRANAERLLKLREVLSMAWKWGWRSGMTRMDATARHERKEAEVDALLIDVCKIVGIPSPAAEGLPGDRPLMNQCFDAELKE